MTWSYSGDPSSSQKDEVRFLCGDTDTNWQLIQDEEIAYILTQRSTSYLAAQDACLAIMASLSRQVDYHIGPERVAASQRAKAYEELYDKLKERWISRNAAPSWDSTSDITQPIFQMGQMDNFNGDDGAMWDLDDDSDRDG